MRISVIRHLASLALCLAAATAPAYAADRGQPIHSQGTLRSDKGTLLRGLELSPDQGRTNADHAASIKWDMTNTYGLNALHVYIENNRYAIGANAAQMDELVSWASTYGYYIIMVPAHSPNGSYDEPYLTRFWNFYAPRYANRSHVIYEIANEPNWQPCSQSYANNGTDVLNSQKRLYTLIRSKAPANEILMLTYSFPKRGSAVQADIAALSNPPNAVNWSHASIAFHGYDWGAGCMGTTDYQAAIQGMKDAANGIPLVMTEFKAEEGSDGAENNGKEWWRWVKAVENTGISYTHFRWLYTDNSRNLSDFKAKMTANGISWKPDFGNWPQASATGTKVASFKTSNKVNYLSAANNGGGTVDTQRSAVGEWEKLTIDDLNGGSLNSGDQIRLRTSNGWYVVAEGGGGPGSIVRANRPVGASWETFTIQKAGGGQITNGSVVTLKSVSGSYVSAIKGGGIATDGAVVADRKLPSTWESFTINFY